MTLAQGRNPGGTVENWYIKVAFLLGKSVQRYKQKIWTTLLENFMKSTVSFLLKFKLQ